MLHIISTITYNLMHMFGGGFVLSWYRIILLYLLLLLLFYTTSVYVCSVRVNDSQRVIKQQT